MANPKESREEIVYRTRRGARERQPHKAAPPPELEEEVPEQVEKPELEEVEEEEVQEPTTSSFPNRPVSNVTCVIVNHKTLELTERVVTSLIACYCDISLILIDNGSKDASTQFLQDFTEEHDNVSLVINERNIGHGPALHQGLLLSDTDFVFFMDSDCIVHHRGFLELMLDAFDEDPFLYVIGQLLFTNTNGVVYRNQNSPLTHKKGIPTIHPHAMMLRKSMYSSLPPFLHSGAPAIHMMKEAFWQRVHIQDFPIHDFLTHLGSGTRKMYGGQWNPDGSEQHDTVEST